MPERSTRRPPSVDSRPAAPRTRDAATAPAAGAATMTAGYAVWDRAAGRFTQAHDVNRRFRSASVVKLLIALDHLWSRDPAAMTAAGRDRLTAMLRSSDDDAASLFWDRNGDRQIVVRMARRLGLSHTAPPPPDLRGWWGYTAMTAADTVRIYRHLADRARPALRGLVLGDLQRATRLAADGVDQTFGVLALPPPRAAKQGWSGFGGSPPAGARIQGLDLRSDALHTTGTLGTDHRYVVAVFTLHPHGTAYATASAHVTRLVRSLRTG